MYNNDLEVKPNVDPELTTLLLSTDESLEIDVVLFLHSEGGRVVDTPEVFEDKANNLINKVSSLSKMLPIKCNVFENIQSLAVRAKPSYLRTLVQQLEISSIGLSHS